MPFPRRVLIGLLATIASVAVAEAATSTTQRKKTQPAPRTQIQTPPPQDQSYLYLSPSSAPRGNGANYVTNGTGIRDQPFYNSISDPGSIPVWSNR